ncbi:flavin reductase family protein [Dictyobacter arantiisoli]|uniref:Flavin-dependent monooxygenase, reductase subunit HsaB n=1 Tax=Dictyobacter arantiisoli TaxID=2014874 RepID=A0A5A5TAH7_9CHLR|nr:flavin reductase family protein [Dictyobacter arantiisoli]GCF08265.1 flavin-dependent monooxygenase, reductase subunit HsaB [Dictyobacter arantiisoli]
MTVFDYPPSIEIRQATTPYFIAPPIDTTRYHNIMGHFATGVAVITTSHRGKPIGFTAHSFCSISAEPALISFCAKDTATIWPLIEAAGTFCVNILSEKQKNMSEVFSRQGGVRFQTTEYSQATSGAPILPGGLAWIECNTVAFYPAGDQLIVLGRVHSMEMQSTGKPLVAYRGTYGTFEEQ